MGNKRVVDTLNRLNENILILGFIVTILVLLIQIIARTFFDNAFGWVEEVARYLFIFFIFGGSAQAFKKGLFISVDALGSFFSRRGKLILDIGSNVLTIVFFLFVAYLGTKLFNNSKGQLTPALQVEIRYVYLTFPVFFLQSAFFAVIKLKENVKNLKNIQNEKGEVTWQ